MMAVTISCRSVSPSNGIGEGLLVDLGFFGPDPVTDGTVVNSGKVEVHDSAPTWPGLVATAL